MIGGLVERQHPGKRKTGKQVTFSTDLIYDVLRKYEPDHLLIQAAWADARARMTDVGRLGDLLDRAAATMRACRARPGEPARGAGDGDDRPRKPSRGRGRRGAPTGSGIARRRSDAGRRGGLALEFFSDAQEGGGAGPRARRRGPGIRWARFSIAAHARYWRASAARCRRRASGAPGSAGGAGQPRSRTGAP